MGGELGELGATPVLEFGICLDVRSRVKGVAVRSASLVLAMGGWLVRWTAVVATLGRKTRPVVARSLSTFR